MQNVYCSAGLAGQLPMAQAESGADAAVRRLPGMEATEAPEVVGPALMGHGAGARLKITSVSRVD